jgi:hypothetical protein
MFEKNIPALKLADGEVRRVFGRGLGESYNKFV